MKVNKKIGNRGKKRFQQGVIKTRKELRKESRKEKKSKKHEFFKRKKNVKGKYVKNPSESSDNMIKKELKEIDYISNQIVEKEKEKQKYQKLEDSMKKSRQRQLKEANLIEDKVIKKLEKQLKLNRRKSKSVPKSFASDGLDYLLEVCDEDKIKHAVVLEQNLHESGSEFEEDFAVITGKRSKTEAIGKSAEDTSDEEDNSEYEFSNDNESSFEDNVSESEKTSVLDEDVSESSSNEVAMKPEPGSEHNKSNNNKETKRMKRTILDEVKTSNVLHKKKKNYFPTNNMDVTNSVTKHYISENSRSHDYEFEHMSDEDCGEGGLFVRLRNSAENGKTARKKTSDSMNLNIKDTVSPDDSEAESITGSDVESKNEYWEDIYGRTRDKSGNVVQVSADRYVPPHLQATAELGDNKKQEQLLKLKKQMKGLLNRLAESNMNKIAIQMDELYMTNSRNDMNKTLTALLLESLVAQVLTPEKLIMEHVMLVAILHANVGTEVGAHFLQVIVKKFNELHQGKPEVEDKTLDNVILIISHLYNFKVFHSMLIYNILEKLAETFGAKEVELILLMLRSIGFSLRRDDPLILKGLVLQLQQKASMVSQLHNDSRVQFMLDVLLAIKNNNMAKIPNYDPHHSEHLKKLMKGFLRKGNYVSELKISLEDLLKAEERGRWWVVGSAWTGLLPGESQSESREMVKKESVILTQNYSQPLLELARKQRMNTDVRRNIFCILMSAEDYLDAFEKLLHLGLKNQQEKEIIHIILHCCLQEKEFNPYYGHLTQKFCDFDRQYRMTLQYTLWDKFKEVQNFSISQVATLARLLVFLFVERGLPISALKVIHFTEVDKATVRLLRQVLLGILLHESVDKMKEVFQRVAASPKLHFFRESMRLFIQHFLLRKTNSLPSQDVQILKDRANVVDRILSIGGSRGRPF